MIMMMLLMLLLLMLMMIMMMVILQAIMQDQWKVVEAVMLKCRSKMMAHVTENELKVVQMALNYRKASENIQTAMQRGSPFDSKGLLW
jgi:flagellar basal body-associated protein FliL